MNFSKIKMLGKTLSKNETKNITGGTVYHGMCESGTTFSFETHDLQSETEAYIERTYCDGTRVAFVMERTGR
ncbi:hypothetical protein [Tenacibaculum amylolyticum]|uniref:hypothetical protein n=1 Tax=Tenacibaculum amylolyticum TaxID=104269 RepID=UPI0038959568